MVVDGAKYKVGSPFGKGAKVSGEIVRQGKAKKINAFNYKSEAAADRAKASSAVVSGIFGGLSTALGAAQAFKKK